MPAMSWLIAATLVRLIADASAKPDTCPTTSDILDSSIPDRYDPAVPSSSSSEVPTASMQIFVTSVTLIDQKNQHIAIDGYYRVSWKDTRLASNGTGTCFKNTLGLPKNLWTKVWQPDIYFDNSLKEEYGAGSFTLSPQGDVYKSQRIHHKFTCPMNFADLPFDTQTCVFKASSYSMSTAELRVGPLNGGIEFKEGYDGTSEFQILSAKSRKEVEYYGDGVNRLGYDFIYLEVTFKRRPSASMKSVFGTCILFALVSWSGTFIERTAFPARVAISVIPVLIMLNLSNSVSSRLPPLNYETWLTSFLFTCTMFCLCAVFEYGLVASLLAKEKAGDSTFDAIISTLGHEKKQAAKSSVETKAKVPHQSFHELPEEALFFRPSKQQVYAKDRRRIAEAKAEETPFGDLSPTHVKVEVVEEEKQPVEFDVPEEVLLILDLSKLEIISASQLRQAFRRVNKRFSLKQIQEIMTDMCVKDVKGDEMTKAELLTLLRDLNTHMPTSVLSTSFWDKPRSEQVDFVFRWCFVIALSLLTFLWLVTAKH